MEDATAPDLPAALAIVANALTLPRLMTIKLFVLPGDPLPQGITQLTGLSQAEAQQIFEQLAAPGGLAQLLTDKPPLLYYYILVGLLACDTPLVAAVEERLQQAGLQLESLIRMAEEVLPMLAQALPDPAAAAATAEALHALFAAEKYSLSATWHSAAPASPATADDEEVWLVMEPTRFETQLFSYAISTTVAARFGVEHPLGAALNAVPALGSDTQLHDLARRFREALPDVSMDLTGPEVLRLYLCLHSFTLLCLADLQPVLMSRLTPHPNAPTPWTDTDQQQAMVEGISRHVASLSQLLDEYFADEPAYQAAQAEVRQLAELL